MGILTKKTEVYRVETEDHAMQMIENYRQAAREGLYEISKASYIKKEKKQKGEVIDAFCLVTIEFKYDYE